MSVLVVMCSTLGINIVVKIEVSRLILSHSATVCGHPVIIVILISFGQAYTSVEGEFWRLQLF